MINLNHIENYLECQIYSILTLMKRNNQIYNLFKLKKPGCNGTQVFDKSVFSVFSKIMLSSLLTLQLILE
ncbi:MAG: hypothetical protein CL661_06130 [Bacteroidetes bacterium]|nr:hypothetical protein [Bacteroidota bacterium]